ncbi:hypothetical protein M9Y10_039583 [Tritrichomonas musculus]|uniref:MULE transposase domain-containing protein n=1 Tax=Tritrichomonas musculus TaxID=1915356 RepID=A0ABR2KBK9_9EUKA
MNALNSTQMMLGTIESFQIETKDLRKYDYDRAANFVIKPQGSDWSFRLLSIFINELTGFAFDRKNGCRAQKHQSGSSYTFMRVFSIEKPNQYFLINIDLSIIVKASKAIIDSWTSKKVKEHWFKRFYEVKLNLNGFKAFLTNSSLIFYSNVQFSSLFHSFAASFVDMNVAPRSDETSQIYSFYDSFLSSKNYKKADLESLKKDCQGYLLLYLTENNNTGKSLDIVSTKDHSYYILGGTYFSAFASDIIKNPNVQGLMLDTTWSVFNKYVTSFPTAICSNVGLPVGFQFGLTEDKKIYTDFFNNFKNSQGFPIEEYIRIIESDQGKSLIAAVEELGLHHLSCLRHFLVSLKRRKYSYQIGNLVSATCLKDFNNLRKIYRNSWKNITDAKELALLNKYLNKAGLEFANNDILIIDQQKWSEISMLERPAFQMPSCTNQIESGHGHLNEQTPRRNDIWHSLKRVIEEIHKRCNNYEENFFHNYARYKRKIRYIKNCTPDDVMNAQIKYYHTVKETMSCDCGEARLMSEMLKTTLPCSHLFSLGVPFPEIQPPKIERINQTGGELFVEYRFIKSEEVKIDHDYYIE